MPNKLIKLREEKQNRKVTFWKQLSLELNILEPAVNKTAMLTILNYLCRHLMYRCADWSGSCLISIRQPPDFDLGGAWSIRQLPNIRQPDIRHRVSKRCIHAIIPLRKILGFCTQKFPIYHCFTYLSNLNCFLLVCGLYCLRKTFEQKYWLHNKNFLLEGLIRQCLLFKYP